MPSRKRSEPLDSFERDVPISAEDSRMQCNVRDRDHLSPAEYLVWCSWITRDLPASEDDLSSDSDEPFEL
jgi:hypothetical protein